MNDRQAEQSVYESRNHFGCQEPDRKISFELKGAVSWHFFRKTDD